MNDDYYYYNNINDCVCAKFSASMGGYYNSMILLNYNIIMCMQKAKSRVVSVTS